MKLRQHGNGGFHLQLSENKKAGDAGILTQQLLKMPKIFPQVCSTNQLCSNKALHQERLNYMAVDSLEKTFKNA